MSLIESSKESPRLELVRKLLAKADGESGELPRPKVRHYAPLKQREKVGAYFSDGYYDGRQADTGLDAGKQVGGDRKKEITGG